MPWTSFKAAVDATCVPDLRFASEMKHVRTEAVTVGDELGHWEVVTVGDSRRVVIAPPVLARLPWPGLPRAVLCGSRSPDTSSDLQRACAPIAGVEVSSTSMPAHAYAPSRIEVVAESEERMTTLASTLGIQYTSESAAWSVAVAACSLDEYLTSLAWEPRTELNWDRRDFDPQRLAFGGATTDGAPLRLSSYSHPSGWAWRDWLWREGSNADADRDWARYAVLSSAGIRVMGYDRTEGSTLVPRQVPLPKLLARALTLSSGRPPSARVGIGLGVRAYGGVPAGLFALIASKIGQEPIEEHKG